MKLRDIGEFGFIERIKRGCVVRPDNVVNAIGDDAAAFTTEQGSLTLVTTDLLVERVHFLRHVTSGFNLGHKSLAVNLSDIAAMGGEGREAFVSIAVPGSCHVAYLEDFYGGMKALASEFDVNILGGDTTASREDLVINITLVGSVSPHEILTRSGARPGDRICATGFLGDSRAGLHTILNDIDASRFKTLVHAHLLPRPCLKEGRFLASQNGITAAMDVSDGLASDLGHMIRSSGVGARIEANRVPISQALLKFCHEFGFDPVDYALSGGEDYVLICTVAPEATEPISRDYYNKFGSPLHVIGEIIHGEGMTLVDPEGMDRPVVSKGWDHFDHP